MFASKALVWENGELVPKPCSVEDAGVREKYTKDDEGNRIKTGKTEVMLKIRYPHNFKIAEQWIPRDRLLK